MADVATALKKMSSDPVVWARVQSEIARASDRQKRFLELAKEEGISLAPADLERALAAARSELGEDELEQVAGGFNPQPDPPKLLGPTNEILIGLLLPAVQKIR